MQKGGKGHFRCNYVLTFMFPSSKSFSPSISILSDSAAANPPITISVRAISLMKVCVSSCSAVSANTKPPAATFAEGATERDVNKNETASDSRSYCHWKHQISALSVLQQPGSSFLLLLRRQKRHEAMVNTWESAKAGQMRRKSSKRQTWEGGNDSESEWVEKEQQTN